MGRVEKALAGALDRVSPSGSSPDNDALRAALHEASTGGKRFRPALVAAAHHWLGGQRDEAVPQVAAAVELLHSAFVVHDDVIDGDLVRRGRPSVPARFRGDARSAGASARSAHDYGVAGAILTGDLALAAAVRSVATAPAPLGVTTRMLDLLDHALATTASGELADVRFSTHPTWPSLAEALSAEERKTAVYSFALPLQLGAVLADAGEGCVAALGDVGRHLGVAFQLRDDLLGVFGNEEVTGKSSMSDLVEGKRTALVVHARETAHWAAIEPHWGRRDVTEADAALVREALEHAGSRAFVEALILDYVEAAVRGAAEVGLPVELVHGLANLCVTQASGAA